MMKHSWLPITSLAVALSFAAGGEAQNETRARPKPFKTLRVNGIQLAYVERGRGEPVVLVHGFMHDYRSWSGQMDALGKRYRVIAYSKRYRHPLGPAPEGADTSLARDVEDLAALIKALNLGRAHVVGHSGGARLAMLLVRKHPELVRSLVLGEGPAPQPPAGDPEARTASPPPFVVEARQAYDRGDNEGAIRIFARGVLGHEPQPSLLRIPLDNAWELRTLGVVRNRSEPPFTCDDAQRIQAPTLVLEGQLSPAPNHARAEAFRKCRPASEHAVLPGSSHGLQMENPAGFNEIVLQFLTRQRRSGKIRAAEKSDLVALTLRLEARHSQATWQMRHSSGMDKVPASSPQCLADTIRCGHPQSGEGTDDSVGRIAAGSL